VSDQIKLGGVHIGGTSHVQAQNIAGETIVTTAPATQVNRLFEPTADIIQQAQPEKKLDALRDLEKLKQEVTRGERADHRVITKLLDRIVDLVPDAIKSLATAFGNPLLAGVAGPATEHLLKKLLNQ